MFIHGNQIKTLNLQTSYDTKLNNATYDALKAFQLNTMNSDTSDLANSKLRDVEASANTFFNSIASNFNMVGYNQDILKEYVPALVYTMYDGYYIYSPYTNTLDDTNSNTITISKDNREIEEITGTDKDLSQNPELDYSLIIAFLPLLKVDQLTEPQKEVLLAIFKRMNSFKDQTLLNEFFVELQYLL